MSEVENQDNKPKPDPKNPEGQEKKGEGEPKQLTQEQVDEIVSKRISEQKAKHQKELEEVRKKERSEAERLAKLNEDEKAEEERKKQQAEIDNRERDITVRELKIEAGTQLQEKGLPTSFIDFVISDDAEKTSANITALEKQFNKSVEEAVNEKLKGKTPEEKSPSKGNTANKQTATVAF